MCASRFQGASPITLGSQQAYLTCMRFPTQADSHSFSRVPVCPHRHFSQSSHSGWALTNCGTGTWSLRLEDGPQALLHSGCGGYRCEVCSGHRRRDVSEPAPSWAALRHRPLGARGRGRSCYTAHAQGFAFSLKSSKCFLCLSLSLFLAFSK